MVRVLLVNAVLLETQPASRVSGWRLNDVPCLYTVVCGYRNRSRRSPCLLWAPFRVVSQ